jgi:hypothetical protein
MDHHCGAMSPRRERPRPDCRVRPDRGPNSTRRFAGSSGRILTRQSTRSPLVRRVRLQAPGSRLVPRPPRDAPNRHRSIGARKSPSPRHFLPSRMRLLEGKNRQPRAGRLPLARRQGCPAIDQRRSPTPPISARPCRPHRRRHVPMARCLSRPLDRIGGGPPNPRWKCHRRFGP